jgi:[acyl-carrier-protein] S-malonyltransferase
MPTGILFSGQGAQAIGMGRSLYENDDIARQIHDRADAILGWRLSAISFEGPEERLTETSVCQPALFVVGIALYEILRARGQAEEPAAMLGLSLGELTALTAAEAMDFETGLRVVAERGRLMQEACDATDGSMASVIGGDPENVESLCREFDIDMANLNCPGQIVVSGESAKVAAAVKAAEASGDFRMIIPLKVAGAYHSRLMQPARDRFEEFLRGAAVSKPRIPVISNTTGERVSDPDDIRTALARQVVSTVRWQDCMRTAADNYGADRFIECGPGKVLGGLARRINRSWPVTSICEYESIPG